MVFTNARLSLPSSFSCGILNLEGILIFFFSFLKRSVPPEKGEVGSKAVHQGGVHPRQPPHLLSDYPSHLTSVPAAQHFLFPPSCLSTHLFSTWNVLDPCPPGLICISSDLRSSQRGVPPVFGGAVSQTWWAPLQHFHASLCLCT